jgi:hypothetical protein
MKIDKLTIQNLKGLSVTETYGAENLIIGKNFLGKTARLQAFQWLLLGYIPGLPRTNPGIYQLASGSPMLVEGWGTDDYHVMRYLEKEGGKITREDSPIGLAETAEPMIAMMDASAFLAASGPDKLEMIFRLAQVETTQTVDTLKARAAAPTWEGFPQAGPDPAVRDWLADALPWAQEQRKFAKQHVDRLAKTQQGVVALQDDADDAPLPNDVDGQISALEASRKPLEARQTELATLKRTAEASTAQYNRAVNSLVAEKQARQAKAQKLEAKAGVANKIRNIQQMIEGHGVVDAEAARGAYMVARDAYAALFTARGQANGEFQLAECELADLEKLECCPHCKSKGKAWKKELAATYEAKRDAARAEVDRIQPLLEQAAVEQTRTLTKMEEQRKSDQLVTGYRTELATQQAAIAQLEQFERDLAVPLSEPQKPAEAHDTVEEEMQLDQQLEQIEEQLAGLRTAKQASDQRKARAATVAQSQLAATTAEEEKKKWDAAVTVLEEARATMVQGAFTALLKAAEPIYSNILETPLVFQKGQVGRMTNAGADFIPLSAFSGTEMLVATIGLQVALGVNSPAKIALLDELGRMDGDNKSQLVKNLHGMVERGELDQYIMIDVTKQPKLPNFITLITP